MNFKRSAIASVILLCGMLVTTQDAHSVVVYHSVSECSESGDFIIYNDTEASVDLVSDNWSHTGLLDPPTIDPWSAKAELNMHMKGDDDNHGTLYFNINDSSGGILKFGIWIYTDGAQRTYFRLQTCDHFTWDGTSSVSQAVGIKDADEAVAQIFTDYTMWAGQGYVVTLYSVNNKDNADNNYNGNTKIILTIMRDDNERFRLGGVTNAKPSNWYPPNTTM